MEPTLKHFLSLVALLRDMVLTSTGLLWLMGWQVKRVNANTASVHLVTSTTSPCWSGIFNVC